MAKENIKKLEEALRSDEALQAKYKETVEAIKAEGKTPSESELTAEVATRLGYPVTAEEIDQAKASGQALSDEELDAVAGGGWWCAYEYGCFLVGTGCWSLEMISEEFLPSGFDEDGRPISKKH